MKPLQICVDASCSYNPGMMRYQGVNLETKERLFSFGPVWATNNIGEFLAIVHAIGWAEQRGYEIGVIYSDSSCAIAWYYSGKCNTSFHGNPHIDRLLARAEAFLKTRPKVNVLKWDTAKLGEIPADFGKK